MKNKITIDYDKNKYDIAVLLPVKNESQNIIKVLTDLQFELEKMKVKWIIYICENMSTDDSYNLIKNYIDNCDNELKSHYFLLQCNTPGKGVTMRCLRSVAIDSAKCYIMMDSDNTYSAGDIRYFYFLYQVNRNYCDVILGKRLQSFKENLLSYGGLKNYLANIYYSKLFSIKYKCVLRDPLTGMRMLSNNFLKTFPFVYDGFETEMEMNIYIVKNNINYREINIGYKHRKGSNLKPIRDGLKILKTMWNSNKNVL